MNFITITGRLARDPEYSDNGTPRVNFTVGVDRRSTRDGDKVDWFRCVAWDGEKSKTATHIRDYFHKGKGIVVSGRMENDPYTDKDGRLRESWAIKVERWEFMLNDPNKQTATQNKTAQGQNNGVSGPNNNEVPDTFEAAEDDIPF